MITLADLYGYLGIPVTAADDTLLPKLEVNAVSIVESWQRITYPPTGSQTEFIHGRGTRFLFLWRNPTGDPTTVIERADVGDAGTPITAAQMDGWVRRDDSVLVRKQTVWKCDYEYEVTYNGGYAPGTEPGKVRQAVLDIVKVAYFRRDKAGGQSESVPGYSYQLSVMNPEIEEILKRLPRRML